MMAVLKMIMNAMTTKMIEMMMMMANPAASIPTLATIMAEPGQWKRSTTNPVMMTMMITIMMTIILVMMIIRGTIHVILALASSLRGLTGTNMI